MEGQQPDYQGLKSLFDIIAQYSSENAELKIKVETLEKWQVGMNKSFIDLQKLVFSRTKSSQKTITDQTEIDHENKLMAAGLVPHPATVQPRNERLEQLRVNNDGRI